MKIEIDAILVEKINSEEGDTHIDGTTGWLLGKTSKFLYDNKKVHIGLVSFIATHDTLHDVIDQIPVAITSNRYEKLNTKSPVRKHKSLSPLVSGYIAGFEKKSKGIFNIFTHEETKTEETKTTDLPF